MAQTPSPQFPPRSQRAAKEPPSSALSLPTHPRNTKTTQHSPTVEGLWHPQPFVSAETFALVLLHLLATSWVSPSSAWC